MADLEDVVCPVSRTVAYPSMRAEVAVALASLADIEHQVDAWLHRADPPSNYDSLDMVVHVLYDDMAVLPDPEKRVGTVVHEGDEVRALLALDQVLGPVLARLGNTQERVYLGVSEWPEVARRAGVALAAMVRGGGVDVPRGE